MQVFRVVMRLIWAAGRKSDSARRMRAQGVDRRVAQPHRGCCKGFPGWEGMSGRWSDQKRWGKPAAVGAPGSCNGRGVIRARVRLRAAPLWWKSGVCPKTVLYTAQKLSRSSEILVEPIRTQERLKQAPDQHRICHSAQSATWIGCFNLYTHKSSGCF